MGRLKILHLITDSGGISGAERVLLGLAAHADRARYALELATVRGDNVLNRALEETGWPVHALGVERARDAPLGLLRLTALLRRFRPAILHTHLFHASLFGALTAPSIGAALVQTRHYGDQIARYGSPAKVWTDRWVSHRCRAIAAVSEGARRHLIDAERVPGERVVTIQNGVDVESLSRLDPAKGRQLLDQLGVPRGPLIGCAASLLAIKGHATLIEAFHRVRTAMPDAQLVLLGRGPEEQPLRAQARKLGVEEAVHMLGHREDVLEAISAVDVYAQPSVEEGFGLALVEAMAMRKAVVASDVGGMVTIVEEGVSGFRVPRGDHAALSSRLIELLGDRALARTLGDRALERVRQRFSLARVVADYDSWYRTLVRT